MHRVVGGRDADGEAQSESLSGGDLSSGGASSAESIALESGSPFGSTSSSASSSNLTSLKAEVEDANGGGNLQDNKVSLLSSDSFTRYTFTFSVAYVLFCYVFVLFLLSNGPLPRKCEESRGNDFSASFVVRIVSNIEISL